MKAHWLCLVLLCAGADLVRGQQPYLEYRSTQTVADNGLAWKRGYIEGYTPTPSVVSGSEVQFMVSTLEGFNALDPTHPAIQTCSVSFYRVRDHLRTLNSSCTDVLMPGTHTFTAWFRPQRNSQGGYVYPGDGPPNYPYDYRTGCNWAMSTTVSTSGWESGVYYAKITIPGRESQGAGYIPFVVRPPNNQATSPILCVISWNTYQAYNAWGGGSLYAETGDFDTPDRDGNGKKIIKQVSFRRPFVDSRDIVNGIRTGFPNSTQMGQLDHRERQFIAWAKDHQVTVDYCVDADLLGSLGTTLTGSHRFLVFAGHSEYWTRLERDMVEQTHLGVANAGNVAFLASNNCYWRVNYSPTGSNNPDLLLCNKDSLDPAYDMWRRVVENGTSMHEARFIGVEYMGNNSIPGVDKPTTVVQLNHWLFRGIMWGGDSLLGHGYYNDIWENTIEPLASGESDMLKSSSHAGTLMLANAYIEPLPSDNPHLGEDGIDTLYSQMGYYEDTGTNSRAFAAGGMGWNTALYGPGSARMSTVHQTLLDHYSNKKYLGTVYSDQSNPLIWNTAIELDGDVDVPSSKGLRLVGGTVTVDGNVAFSDNGVIEAYQGSTTITGQNGQWGQLAVRNGGVLRVKSGATLTLQAPLYFVLQTGSSLVVESGATLNIKTNTSCGSGVNITVPAGATLNVQVPAEIYMSPNCAVIDSGALNITGTANQHVIFDRLGAGDPWVGISYRNSGSTGTVSYATIQNAQKGIEGLGRIPSIDHCTIQGNWTAIWASAVPAALAGEIQYNTLQNNATSGIFLSDAFPQNVHHNTISGNTYGIYCYGGAIPYLSQNTIQDNDTAGVICLQGSHARLGPTPPDAGHNIVRQNGVGIICDASNAFFGQGTYFGYNSIYDNTTYAVRATGNSQLWGQFNYWKYLRPPYYDTTKFAITPGSSIRLEYAQENNPNPGALQLTDSPGEVTSPQPSNLLVASASGGSVSLGTNPDTTSFFDSDLIRSLQLVESGDYDGAIKAYRERFAKETNPAKRYYVLEQLGSCYRFSGRAGFAALLASDVRPAVTASDRLFALSLELEALDCMARGEFTVALEPFKKLAAGFGDTERFAKHALFNLGYIHLLHLENLPAAEGYFGQLQAGYPGDRLTALAQEMLKGARDVAGIAKGGSTGQPAAAVPLAKKPGQESTPTAHRLEESYPNPFNPSTSLRFALPEDAHVELTVHDLLGREVATLARGPYAAGSHTVTWYAEAVASGLYLARLEVKDNSGKTLYRKTNKLLLTK